MKKTLAFTLSIVFLASPALVLADTAIPTGPTPLQLLTRVAALEAQEASIQSGQMLACSALFSTSSVQVNEPVALAWGSVGATTTANSSQVTWTPEGATTVSIQTPGDWKYSFTFYGANGGSTTCTASVTVTQ